MKDKIYGTETKSTLLYGQRLDTSDAWMNQSKTEAAGLAVSGGAALPAEAALENAFFFPKDNVTIERL